MAFLAQNCGEKRTIPTPASKLKREKAEVADTKSDTLSVKVDFEK
jgi:hypothetical protein